MSTSFGDWWQGIPSAGRVVVVTAAAGAVLFVSAVGMVGWDRFTWRNGVVERDRVNPGIVLTVGTDRADQENLRR